MGYGMMCVTAPKTEVMQGDAITHENRCVTTPPLKGGRVVVMLRHLLAARWCPDLVPMPLFLSGGEAAVRAYAFALCGLGVLR